MNSPPGIGTEIGRGSPEHLPVNVPEVDVGANLQHLEATISAVFCEAGTLGGSETILLVEDEIFVRNVTAEVLNSAGYRVLTAEAAAEALKADRKHGKPIQLLLADVVMPGMSGRELAVEFEDLHPHVRVLLMSGYAEQLARSELSLFNQNCLAKPFTARTLLKRVREALDAVPLGRGQA